MDLEVDHHVRNLDNYGKTEITQAIASLNNIRQQLITKTASLKRYQHRALEDVYAKFLSINEEMANKYFGELDNGVAFSERIEFVTKAMQSEIKKLESNLDITIANDDELEDKLKELNEKESELESLELGKDPDYNSKEIDFILQHVLKKSQTKSVPENTQVVEILQHMDQRNMEFDNEFAVTENKIHDRIKELQTQAQNKTSETIEYLTKEQEIWNKEILQTNDKNHETLEEKYDEILHNFIQKSKGTHLKYIERYNQEKHKLNPIETNSNNNSNNKLSSPSHRATTNQLPFRNNATNGNNNSNIKIANSTATITESKGDNTIETPWKVEVVEKYTEMYQHEQHCIALEHEIDDILLQQIHKIKIDVGADTMDLSYLDTVLVNLSKLYNQINEITLQEMNNNNSSNNNTSQIE